jgi:tripartite-type tricarboxylate transporter receptor subunit TctC
VLGQRIVLDNRPGQSGNIGVEIASRAATALGRRSANR